MIFLMRPYGIQDACKQIKNHNLQYSSHYSRTIKEWANKKRQPQIEIVFMSGRQDSNLRPPGPKPGALPGCATPRCIKNKKLKVGATGFEPAAAWSQTRSATGLRYTPLYIIFSFANAKVALLFYVAK